MHPELSPLLKQALLDIARGAITAHLAGENYSADPQRHLPELAEPAGCFVSLHQLANHELRGCIGCLEARQALGECVAEHAVACAFADPRFVPLSAGEVPALELDVSVLSALESIAAESPEHLLAQLEIGTHGLLLRGGRHQATFLPQVWQSLPEPQQFLDALLHKGGWHGWPDDHALKAWRYTVSHAQGPLAAYA